MRVYSKIFIVGQLEERIKYEEFYEDCWVAQEKDLKA